MNISNKKHWTGSLNDTGNRDLPDVNVSVTGTLLRLGVWSGSDGTIIYLSDEQIDQVIEMLNHGKSLVKTNHYAPS